MIDIGKPFLKINSTYKMCTLAIDLQENFNKFHAAKLVFDIKTKKQETKKAAFTRGKEKE